MIRKFYRSRRFARFFPLFFIFLSAMVAPASAAAPVKIGATVSLHGKFTAPSLMVKQAYELWAAQINAKGGLLGRPAELILYDDMSRTDIVGGLYEKLISEDGVDLVLAPYGTGLTYAASETTERRGYVMLASAASGEMIWQRGFRYVFGVYSPAKRYFIGFLDLIARNGLKSLAVLGEDAMFTRAAADGVKAWGARFGLQTAFDAVYPADADKRALLTQVKTSGAGALALCTYPPDGYAFLREMAAMKYRPAALGMSITPSLPDFAQKAGAMAEGVFGPSQWEPDERLPYPGTRQFVKDFEAFAGRKPSYHAGSAYAACQLLEKTVVLHQTLDQKKIRDYIAALDAVTVIGRFKVDPDGRQIGHNAVIIQWQDGRKEIVYPTKMQTAPPRIK